MDFYKGTIPIIDDTPAALAYAMPQAINGHAVGYGYVPRDYGVHPQQMFGALPDTMPIYEESEWDALYDEQEATKSSLEHAYLSGPNGGPIFENLDQNGDPYCWAYSVGQAIMMVRARMNQPLVRINPHAAGAIIKGGRAEGGWCGLSAKFAREHGYAVEGTGPGQWPLHSRNLKYDTPELRGAMALHKVTEEFCDLTKSVYDQNLTRKQDASSLFNLNPGPRDYNWWSHSVCAIRWVRIEPGDWGPLILNSWKGWGRHGLSVLRGSKARCDGGLALCSMNPS